LFYTQLTAFRQVSKFLWAKIVQLQLNKHVNEHRDHTIRSQNINLPSGGSPYSFYRFPNQWEGSCCLIEIPQEDIDVLVSRYVPSDLFVFCDQRVHNAATVAMETIEVTDLTPKHGWNIFCEILPVIEELLLSGDTDD
jgi:hypothetical protein